MDLSDISERTVPVFVVTGYYGLVAVATGVTARSVLTLVQRRSSGLLGPGIVDTIYTLHVFDTLLLLGPLTGVLTGIYVAKMGAEHRWFRAVQAGVAASLGFIVLVVIVELVSGGSSVDLLRLPDEWPLLLQTAAPTGLVAAVAGFVGTGRDR